MKVVPRSTPAVRRPHRNLRRRQCRHWHALGDKGSSFRHSPRPNAVAYRDRATADGDNGESAHGQSITRRRAAWDVLDFDHGVPVRFSRRRSSSINRNRRSWASANCRSARLCASIPVTTARKSADGVCHAHHRSPCLDAHQTNAWLTRFVETIETGRDSRHTSHRVHRQQFIGRDRLARLVR